MEDNRSEYKRELTDGLEKEVVAFLNYKDGGVIYIGIAQDGRVYGVEDPDGVQLAIKDRLRNNIQPSIMGLFDIAREVRDQKNVIRITVAGGLEKPYYLRKYGMTERGCFIRVGSAAEPMPRDMIETLFGRRVRNTIGNMLSPRPDLSFEQLKIYYDARGLALNEAFMKNLELLTPEGKPNYAAYLLADDNGVSLQVAKYAGTTRDNLIENRDFGKCSLVKALKGILDRMEVENTIFTKIGYPLRKEQEMIDSTAMREAVVNAVVHNDYSYGAVPKFEFFSDRLEITSMGGLPYGVDEEDFFSGFSVPRNKEIMRVFRDLEIVEQLGSGIPRILKTYGREAFEICKSLLRVVFYYTKPQTITPEKHSGKTLVDGLVGRLADGLAESQRRMLELIAENPRISKREMAERIGISTTAIDKNIAALKTRGLLTRIGTHKGGHWKVVDDHHE
jgi:predicted HTH transcriptional regulator